MVLKENSMSEKSAKKKMKILGIVFVWTRAKG
jgi:hypothetical protein